MSCKRGGGGGGGGGGGARAANIACYSCKKGVEFGVGGRVTFLKVL